MVDTLRHTVLIVMDTDMEVFRQTDGIVVEGNMNISDVPNDNIFSNYAAIHSIANVVLFDTVIPKEMS